MGTQSGIFHALADLNRAALGQEAWETGLQKLGNALQVEAVTFEEFDAQGNERIYGYTAFDDAVIRDYVAHYHRLNPRLDCVVTAKVGEALTDDFMAPPLSRRRSEFFNWFDQTAEFRYCMGVKLRQAAESWAALAIHRPSPQTPFEPGTQELLQSISPNLVAIYETARELEAMRANELIRSLDLFRTAVAFLTPGGRVAEANAAFVRLLGLTGLLLTDRTGRLCGGSNMAQAAVEQAIGAAAGGRALSLTLNDEHLGPIFLHFLPQPSSVFPDAPQRSRVLLLARGRFSQADLASELKDLFGLTEREAQIAQGIALSRPLEAVANDFGISLATARVHLRNIFEKTGTHRQAELAAMMASAAAP